MPIKQRQRRSGCPIAFGLDIFGDKWTLLVLRDLLIENKATFREFLTSPEGIATNVLADRLDRLAQSGLVSKIRNPGDGRGQIYAATEAAERLVPALMELAYWGATHDPLTDAPSAFAEAYRKDRDGLCRSMAAAARRDKVVPSGD